MTGLEGEVENKSKKSSLTLHPLDMKQAIEGTTLNAPSPRNSKVCYTGRRPKLRILRGSI
jgi:hypothetical protein